MIVPMKRIIVVVQQKEAAFTVKELRSLGIVHIQHQRPPQGEEINTIREQLALVSHAVEILTQDEKMNFSVCQTEKAPENWEVAAKHIIDCCKRVGQLEDYARNLRQNIRQWELWGDFDPRQIEILASKGIYLRLFQISVKQLKDLPKGVIVRKINVKAGFVSCLVLSKGKTEINFNEIPLPKMGLKEMESRLAQDIREIEIIKEKIFQYACYRNPFIRIRDRLRYEQEYQEVFCGMERVEQLTYLKGFIPFDQAEYFMKSAKQRKWGVVVIDPSQKDTVPTLLRNPKWVQLISPLFKSFAIVPGYRELDISFWFLISISLFFGILIGDAGYGLVYILLTLYAQKKFGKKFKDKSIFNLLYLLDFCAIIWGVLSATYFGQEWLPEWVKPVVPALRNELAVQTFCFLLGAVHLSIAHLWRALIKFPSPVALADIGWMLILWGSFYLARFLVLSDTFPGFAKWFFIIGPFLVMAFANSQKNILKRVGSGIGTLLLSFVNTFTDVVSYIRLFAVGMATVAVADAFNKMAQGIGFDNFFTCLGALLILLVAHSLNIALGPMAVLVHGVRLNVLEFCGHLGIQWTGIIYKPFKELQMHGRTMT